MIINTVISFTQNIVRACSMSCPYEGYRSVTPIDAARINRTIFHNHSVHWYYITLIKGRYYIEHDINVRHGKQNPRRGRYICAKLCAEEMPASAWKRLVWYWYWRRRPLFLYFRPDWWINPFLVDADIRPVTTAFGIRWVFLLFYVWYKVLYVCLLYTSPSPRD